MGWKAPCYFASGAMLLVAIIQFLFLEETTFNRSSAPAAVTEAQVVGEAGNTKDGACASIVAVNGDFDNDMTNMAMPLEVEEVYQGDHVVHSFDRLVTPWPGPRPFRKLTISQQWRGLMWRGILYPLALLRLPIILWCGVIFALYQVFYNGMIALSSGMLSAEPYNFKPDMVGLTFLSPLLAIVPGAVFGGWLVDWYTIRQARKNDGVSEPEHKIKLMIIPTVLAPFGLLMIGLGPFYGAHWAVFVVGEFVLTVSGPLATLLSLTYAFDSYHRWILCCG